MIKEPLWLALMVVIGMVVGTKLGPNTEPSMFVHVDSSDTASKIGRVEEVIRFIESKYVEEVESDALIENALQSLFAELDPHSNYIPPTQLLDVEEDMRGLYDGIGILTIFRDDTLYVQKVIEDAPAAKAGLKIGDRILAIGDTKMSGTGKIYADLRPAIQFGNLESKDILFSRRGKNQKISVTAEEIRVSAVETSYMLDSSTVFIKLKRFSENVYNEFLQSIDSLISEPSKPFDLVLDLRDNPGGYLPETIKILNQIFKEKDRLLVYTVDRVGKKTEYKTNGNRFYNLDKIAVLVNENSASASEIIAGAIQDWDRGIVLGTPSFGKGLVQEQYKLRNGGAIRLTVSKYHTPTGRLIQKPYKEDFAETKSDTTEFYTKELRRKVTSSGGINPDFMIPTVSDIEDNEFCTLAKQEMAFFFAREIENLEGNNSKNRFLEEFTTYMQTEYEVTEDQLCLTDLDLEYDHMIIGLEKGESVMFKAKNNDDPVVMRALSQLKRGDYFSF